MQEHMDRSGQMMGEYRLLRWLGGGGFGNVYLAEHLHEPGRVAVKVLTIRLARSEDLKAFLNEARTMRLRHPHIVPLLDFGLSEQELPFLVMEFQSLGSIRGRYPRGTQLPLSTVQLYTGQIASALAYAHEHRLVHRDVKPENMLMRDARTVLLSDFGIASVAHSTQSLSLYQGFGGTVPYAAPEQLEGRPRPASDQYSLAVVAYEWLAGRRPFEGTPMEVAMQHAVAPPPSLLGLVPTLPPTVEQVIFTALAKDPGERFSSVWDFAQALREAFEQSRPTSSTVVTRPVAQLRPSPPALPPSAGQTLRFAPAVTSPPAPSYPTPILAPAVRRSRFPGYTTPRTVTVTGTGIPQAADPQRLSGKRTVLLILLALLLVGSASLGYVGLKSHSERMSATVTARASLTGATQAQDTLPAYEQAVAAQGIMEGFDVARSNSNPYERMLTPSNVPRLALRWSYKVGRSVQSTPVEAGGIVYVGSDKLYAFDAGCRSACQPLWSYGIGAPGLGSPAVVMGLVYAVGGDGKLYVFDATCRTACQPLWSYDTGGLVYDTPVVSNGMVYVGSHYDGPNYAVTHLEDLKLFAFDTSCHNACQPLWSYTMKDFIDPPTVANGILYVGTVSGNLYAFDASCRSTCQPLWSWSRPNPENLPHSPVVVGRVAYVLFQDGQLYAFDASCRSACQPLWSYQAGSFSHASPSTDEKILFVSSSDALYAFDTTCRSACQPLWSWPWGGLNDYSSPFLANGVIYIGIGNTTAAFNASCRSACQALWSYTTGDRVESDATVANGVLYAGSEDGQLYAFGLPQGH